jgi:hypothetical protein
MSKLELLLLQASQNSASLENYQFFGLLDYCRIIELFLYRDCHRAARLFTHMCFKVSASG